MCNAFLAYLEKQKEQPKEELVYRLNGLMQEYIKEGKDEAEKEHRFKCYQLFWDALEDTSYFEQKEQKPAEKQDYSGLTDLERAIHRGFLSAGVENVPVTIIKETARECLAQKPVEWSEEDERMRNQLIYDVERHKKEGLISAKQNKATKALYDGIEKCYDEKIAWLKSLSPHPHWKPSEERIGAVRYFVNKHQSEAWAATGQWKQFTALRGLLGDLQKLM